MKKKIFFYEDMVAMNEKSNKKIYAFRGKNGQDRERKRQQVKQSDQDAQGSRKLASRLSLHPSLSTFLTLQPSLHFVNSVASSMSDLSLCGLITNIYQSEINDLTA